MDTTPEPTKTQAHRAEFWLTALRGFVGRCPACGHGKLLRSYLKPVFECSACHEPYGHIRADDGPAWLTIVLVGHVMGTLLLAIEPSSTLPGWVSMLLWPTLAILLALIILPRAKGLFIALSWRARCAGSEP